MGGLLTEPLRAIDLWTQTISANITDVNMPGFKLRRVRLGDGAVDVDRPPEPTDTLVSLGGRVSLQFPRATLLVTATPIDFTQGSIEKTSINTHYAIKDRPGSPGTNFFVMIRDFDQLGEATRSAIYLSRDGEFHWTDRVPDGVVVNPNFFSSGTFTGMPPGPYLVNSYGLYVMGVREFQSDAESPTGLGQTMSPIIPVSQGFFQPPYTDIRPPVHPLVMNIKFPQNLVYSEFGSNIFLFKEVKIGLKKAFLPNDVAAGAASLPVANDGYRYNNAPPANPTAPQKPENRGNVFADVESSALERANYTLMPLFPEMSNIQKTFVSISKVITVLTQNMDAILATTR